MSLDVVMRGSCDGSRVARCVIKDEVGRRLAKSSRYFSQEILKFHICHAAVVDCMMDKAELRRYSETHSEVTATISADYSNRPLSATCSSASALGVQVVTSLIDEDQLVVDTILQQPISIYASLNFDPVGIPLRWRVLQLLHCYEFSVENCAECGDGDVGGVR